MKKISTAAHRMLNDSRKLQEREKWFGILNDLFEGKDQENAFLREYVPVVTGWIGRSGFALSPRKEPLAYSDPESWVVECLEEMAEYAASAESKPWFEPLCLEYGIFGTHFIDRIFGSNVFYHDAGEQEGQWGAYPGDKEVGLLEWPDLEHSETWKLAKTAAQTFAAQEVALPLFGLPTIASALNIGVNLLGANLLAEMCEEPEKAVHDMTVINQLLMEAHRFFRKIIPSAQVKPVVSWQRTLPEGYGQICGCSTQMLSGSLYEELVASLDAALLGVYPKGGCIHLCGRHTQHIGTWSRMAELRAIQTNGIGLEDLRQYFHGLRDDQILYVYPYDGAPVEQLLALTGGRRLVLMGQMEPPRK